MTLLKKRTRMVSIRLSDEEFELLKEVCASQGARSISDLARHAMMDAGRNGDGGPMEKRLRELDARVSHLHGEVARLSALLNKRPS